MIRCYKNLINIKRETAGTVVIVLVMLNCEYIRTLLTNCLNERYGEKSSEYIMRILILAQLVLAAVYISRRFLIFCRKNYESLLVLGLPQSCILALFVCADFRFFLAQLFFCAVFGRESIENLPAVAASGVVNGFLLCVLAVLFVQSSLFKYRYLILGAGLIGTGALLLSA